jgi:hypothetical protein
MGGRMMPKDLVILKNARTLIEKGWCQGAWARNKKGKPVQWDNSAAASWCLRGAIHKGAAEASSRDTAGATVTIERILRDRFHVIDGLTWWNDDPKRTKKDVLKALDIAIKEKENAQR